METFTLPSGLKLVNVHPVEACKHQTACVVHKPTNHHMSSWPLVWRNDIGLFERACEHGVGHPDPDQFHYWKQTGQRYLAVHGCDGCCDKTAS